MTGVCVSCALARGKVAEYARLATAQQREGHRYEGYVAKIERLKRAMRECADVAHVGPVASSRAGGESKKRTVAS